MKLTGQASQYWTNLENIHASRLQWPIETWDMMKDELKGKYAPLFSDRLMDKWYQCTQGNKSVKEYVIKFNEFLIRCSAFSKEGQAQILSKFKAVLREDLRTELLIRGVTEFEKAYTIVQDLDSLKCNSTLRV